MSEQVRNAIDHGLDGLRVTERDVREILRRARSAQAPERRTRPMHGAALAIAAVLVMLVAGAAVRLLGGAQDTTPLDQPNSVVTEQPVGTEDFQPVGSAVPVIHIQANDALVIAEAYIHERHEPAVDLRDSMTYDVSCQYVERETDGEASWTNFWQVTFRALTEHATEYALRVDAAQGHVLSCRVQRGVGLGHTAEEIRVGYGRIWGTDMAQWTWKEMASYRNALKNADLGSLCWLDVLMRDNSAPDPSAAFLSRDEATQAALDALAEKGVRGEVEAAVYLRAGAQKVWRVTVAQEAGADGMAWVHFVEIDANGSVTSHTRVDRANAFLLPFVADGTLRASMQLQENSDTPALEDEMAYAIAAEHIRQRYGETADVNDPALYTRMDAGGVMYATIDRYIVYAPVDPAGTTYWVCVDWYGGIVDSGAGREHDGVTDVDLLRMQAVNGVPVEPHENEPGFYIAYDVPFASGFYYPELFALQELLREKGDPKDPVAQLLLNTEYVQAGHDNGIDLVHQALGVKFCNTDCIHIRRDGRCIQRMAIQSERGDFLVEFDCEAREILSAVQVRNCFDPWYAPFLLQADMEQAGIAPEPYTLPEAASDGRALTPEEVGVVRGMRISHLNDRYRALYGRDLANWSQEQLRSWQRMAIVTESVSDDLGVFCLRNTYYPDIPVGAISRETAAEIAAQAVGFRDGWTMDGAVIIGTDGDPVWKVCLHGVQAASLEQTAGYWYAEVNCMTGEVTAAKQRLGIGAWELPNYSSEPLEYWFRDVVLEETIEECEEVWDCKSNG